MKNLKMLYIALIALVAGAFVACTSEFDPGPQVSGPQVAFVSTNATSVDLTGDPAEATQKLVLSRVETKDELTVFVNAEASEGAHLFSIPEEVTFAAGEATAELVYTLDCNNFASDKTYTVNFLILDELGNITTPYGYKEWTVTYAVNPWVLLKDDKGNNAKGKFRGNDLLTTLFDIDPEIEIDVNVYEHKMNKGVYKVENPWALSVAAGFGYVSVDEAKEDGIVFTNVDFIIDASNPAQVVIGQQQFGVDFGYGPMYIESGYPRYMQDPAVGSGTMEDGVITFPAKSCIFAMPGYSSSAYYANNNGLFRLVLPGVEVANYSLTVAYEGMDVAADNTTCTAKLKFTYGADVTGINYMVVKGNVESNPAEALTTLFAGEDENILSVENFVKGSGETGVKVGLEQGIYTIVAAPADKNGALRSKEALVKSFYFPGLGAPEEHPCVVSLEARKMSEVADIFPNATEKDYEAFAVNIMGEDIKAMKYYLNTTSVIEGAAAQGLTLDLILAEYGEAIGSESLAVINSETGMATYFRALEANTNYTFAIWAENNYGESTIVTVTHSTDPLPYEGELVIGSYMMSCTMAAGTKDETTFENVFDLIPVIGSQTEFLVSKFAIEDNMKWKATYDATASTLTLSGEASGLENYGPLFGNAYGIYDQAETMYYGIFSFATEASDKGTDPVVLKVDPTTKQLCGLKQGSSVYVYIFAASNMTLLGSYGAYDDTTVIAPYSNAATASVKSVKSLAKSSTLMPLGRTNKLAEFDNKLKNNKAVNFTTNGSNRGFNTIKVSIVESYSPVKVKGGFKAVKANATIVR